MVIPHDLFLLILLAGHLRWEKGPLQHTDAYQVQHTKDQWTGQRWIILYGGMAEESADPDNRPYPLYSGEWLPHFTREELDLRLEEVLSRPEYHGKRQLLQQRIKDLEMQVVRSGEEASEAETDSDLARQALYEANWELNTLYAGAKQVLLAETARRPKNANL